MHLRGALRAVCGHAEKPVGLVKGVKRHGLYACIPEDTSFLEPQRLYGLTHGSVERFPLLGVFLA